MDVDPIAKWYRWIEYAAFGRTLERSRLRFIDRLAGADRVLVLGEGDGRMLRRMLAAAPAAHFDVIEMSAAMIALARNRAGPAVNRVRFLQGDARSLLLAGTLNNDYDAAIACYFLDCLEPEEALSLIERASEHVKPGARWLITEFAIPERGWRRWHAMAWVQIMYRWFAITTGLRARALPPVNALMAECGWESEAEDIYRWGLIRCSLWKRHVKE